MGQVADDIEASCQAPHRFIAGGAARAFAVDICKADVAVIGAGLAGSLAAFVLAQRGMRVAVIDRHATCPRDFRCEKISGTQMAVLQELGALDCLASIRRPFNRVLVARGGRTAGFRYHAESGFTYSNAVNALRKAWPSNVTFMEGRAEKVAAGRDRQRITLPDGRIIDARLIIVATGLNEKLHAGLGLKRKIVRRGHSFVIGFNVAPADKASFPFEALTYFGERSGDRIGYATFFPTDEGMRVNLFTYHEQPGDWAETFRADPIGTLRAAMPGITPLLGDIRIASVLDMRPVDLYETEGHDRDGIVVIGDAFRTSCPATGTGVTRLLTDVRQLCLIHIPRWFATGGMDAGKIASFYGDPIKRACDERAMRLSERGRAFASETSFSRRIERGIVLLGAHVHGAIEHLRRRI